MHGGSGDDVMTGDALGNYAYGSGNDVMHSGNGDDFMVGDVEDGIDDIASHR